jgi:PmbA protein
VNVAPAHPLEEIAARLVRLALDRGATGAEATASEGSEFTCRVRLGEVEQVKDAGSRGAGIRVLRGQCAGSATTSDLSDEGLRQSVEQALALAAVSTEDPHAGLPAAAELGVIADDLQLHSPTLAALPPAGRIALARRAEAAALETDARITNSEGATFSANHGRRAFANSLGFVHSYASTSCSLSAIPVAAANGRLERDWWSHAARSLDDLESPEDIGRTAAARVLRRLGARKPATCKVPVVFEPRTARTLLGHLFSAVTGEAVWQQATFLHEMLGRRIAPPGFTVIDDATMPGRFGTSPCDDEGVRSRRTPVVEDGILASWLLHSYTARRLGARTTGNAARGLAGTPSAGHGCLALQPGTMPPDEIIGSIPNGFYVTELLGSGVNIVNGDYSRGAAGLWIENGQLAWPVHEATIAGNLARMFASVEAIGADLDYRTSLAAPTILIGEMTVSGT